MRTHRWESGCRSACTGGNRARLPVHTHTPNEFSFLDITEDKGTNVDFASYEPIGPGLLIL